MSDVLNSHTPPADTTRQESVTTAKATSPKSRPARRCAVALITLCGERRNGQNTAAGGQTGNHTQQNIHVIGIQVCSAFSRCPPRSRCQTSNGCLTLATAHHVSGETQRGSVSEDKATLEGSRKTDSHCQVHRNISWHEFRGPPTASSVSASTPTAPAHFLQRLVKSMWRSPNDLF